MAEILITGGSGLIGSALTERLLADGHGVRHLSRTAGDLGKVKVFKWDLRARSMDDRALSGVEHIVHLAGAPIADQRWTRKRINELISSRADTALFLLEYARRSGVRVRTFVSAAGSGYYGANTTDELLKESHPAGNDELAHISKEWESAVDRWASVTRVVKLRTPLVLADKGGALPKLAKFTGWGLGSPLGSGDQWMPWVHIEDIVQAYVRSIKEPTMSGAFNVSAKGQVTNRVFMKTLAKVLHRPIILPAVPSFVLNVSLGKMSSILLEGTRLDSSRIRSTGMHFRHEDLAAGLTDLLRSDAGS